MAVCALLQFLLQRAQDPALGAGASIPPRQSRMAKAAAVTLPRGTASAQGKGAPQTPLTTEAHKGNHETVALNFQVKC